MSSHQEHALPAFIQVFFYSFSKLLQFLNRILTPHIMVGLFWNVTVFVAILNIFLFFYLAFWSCLEVLICNI